jgi:hypothetical protein
VETAEATGDLDGIRVVELPAEIDLDSAAQVQAALAGALAAGVTVLVADMTATVYCTMEGVQALLRARRAGHHGQDRAPASCSPCIPAWTPPATAGPPQHMASARPGRTPDMPSRNASSRFRATPGRRSSPRPGPPRHPSRVPLSTRD